MFWTRTKVKYQPWHSTGGQEMSRYRRIMSVVFVVLLIPLVGQTIDPPNVAWWKMEDKVLNEIPDASGNGHHLTINGSPTFADCIVTFNDDGTLEAADSVALDLLGDWSISFWAREDAITGGGNGWVQKYRNFGDSEGGWFVISDSFRLRTGIMRGPNCSYDAAGPLPLGTWTRITTTFDATTMTVSTYWNDSLKFSSNIPTNPVPACTLLPNVHPVLIGGYLDSDGKTKVPDCNGAMADIRVYDYVLSASEVAELAANCHPTTCPCPVSVVIDIKPGSDPNSVNLASHGVIPVAILTTDDFDATTVDPDTVELAGSSVAIRGNGSRLLASHEDVDGDGDIDLVLHMETENLNLETGATEGTLTGETFDGQAISGSDIVVIVNE